MEGIYFNVDFVLHDVLFVSTFKYNLLYVTKLSASMKYEFVFSATNYLIHNSITKKKIGSTSAFDGLYYLDVRQFMFLNKDTGFSISCNRDEFWHYKLGYINNFMILTCLLSLYVKFVLSLNKRNCLSITLTLFLNNPLTFCTLIYGDLLLFLWMDINIS